MANALNPNIILQGQGLDVIGSMDAGAIAGQRARTFQNQNALNGYLQQNGAQVMGGDQNALNGLSSFGLEGLNAAQGVQSNRLGMEQTRLGMDATRQNMQLAQSQEARLTRAEERAIQEHAASLSAEQRAQEAAQIEQAVAQGLATTSPQQWDAVVGQIAPDLVGQFDNREVIAGRYMSIADVLKRTDERNAPQTTGYIATGEAATSLGLPADGAYNIESGPNGVKASAIGGGGTNVTTNILPEGGGVTDEFYKVMDKSQADMFGSMLGAGANTPAKLAQIDELEAVISTSPMGVEAGIKSALGKYGIQTDGLDSIQAAEALINRMIPAQRAPGSGPMSDKDIEMFKASLPGLLNSPEGNRQIIATMRGLAVYEQRQAEIADRVAAREITPTEGRRELMALENPLKVGSRSDGATVIGGGYTIREIK